MDEIELRNKYNVWKTADIKGSSETKEDDEWLSLRQVMHLITNLTKHNNDFKKDWRIQAIQKANSNKKINKKTLEELREYRQSFIKS